MRRINRVDIALFEGLEEKALEVAQIEAAAPQADLAEVPITPRFGPGTWRHFHPADRFLVAGLEAAEAVLPHLAALARPQLSA